MKTKPYNPFESANFDSNTCFLSGEKLSADNKQFVPVFPAWILERYQLHEATIGMLGGNRMKYGEMLLPVSKSVFEAVNDLDKLTEKAFTEGYAAVKDLSELTLFQWMARILYGVLYQDFTYTISRHQAKGRAFSVSGLMQQKLKNLHGMLQSLIRPVSFDGFCPWSIACFPVNYFKDGFNYKDETHKLNFCLGMNGFGIVACLQDNGEISKYYEDVLKMIGDSYLHPAQFEELYGRFMYANYVLREFPDYTLTEEDGTLVFHLPEYPEIDGRGNPRFAEWKDDIFSQVLANMWEAWGIPLKDIYSFPNSPISFLVNENTNKFIEPETVKLSN